MFEFKDIPGYESDFGLSGIAPPLKEVFIVQYYGSDGYEETHGAWTNIDDAIKFAVRKAERSIKSTHGHQYKHWVQKFKKSATVHMIQKDMTPKEYVQKLRAHHISPWHTCQVSSMKLKHGN